LFIDKPPAFLSSIYYKGNEKVLQYDVGKMGKINYTVIIVLMGGKI